MSYRYRSVLFDIVTLRRYSQRSVYGACMRLKGRTEWLEHYDSEEEVVRAVQRSLDKVPLLADSNGPPLPIDILETLRLRHGEASLSYIAYCQHDERRYCTDEHETELGAEYAIRLVIDELLPKTTSSLAIKR